MDRKETFIHFEYTYKKRDQPDSAQPLDPLPVIVTSCSLSSVHAIFLFRCLFVVPTSIALFTSLLVVIAELSLIGQFMLILTSTTLTHKYSETVLTSDTRQPQATTST
jgi:hypothetical protein